jgi:hypothetical protein
MAKPRPQAGGASNQKRTVMPRWRPNAEQRRREHLTKAEVERLMEAATFPELKGLRVIPKRITWHRWNRAVENEWWDICCAS